MLPDETELVVINSVRNKESIPGKTIGVKETVGELSNA